ncbi:putative efflux pump protein [Escherichia coli]|uniref:Putative efflux pump protein n=1 Tax=Escherichia coli TaxID=562 RepID=A0A376TF35_ECOLX|nr:putative efflux pump protein [Escherichia coli]
MNASSWSLRNLPWFKATLAQWCYALRNTIAMCLALTVAYYLNLDEPYWAMTSAAVVSFPHRWRCHQQKPRTHRWQFTGSHCGTASCRAYAQ